MKTFLNWPFKSATLGHISLKPEPNHNTKSAGSDTKYWKLNHYQTGIKLLNQTHEIQITIITENYTTQVAKPFNKS